MEKDKNEKEDVLKEYLEYAQKLNQDICELGLEADVMRKCRDELFKNVESQEMRCIMYQLTVLELMTNEVLGKLKKIERAEKEKERFVVEADGRAYVVDFESGLGTKTEVKKMTEKEYRDYVNRRANTSIYEV